MRKFDKVDKLNRRTVLKGISVAATGLSPLLVSVGAAGRGNSGAQTLGIDTEVKNHLQSQNVDAAIQLLNENDVEYSYSLVPMPSIDSLENTTESSGGQVGTQAEYGKGNSEFGHIAFHLNGMMYHSYIHWTLRFAGGSCVDSAGPKDGAGITVSEFNWEPKINSWQFGDHTSLDERGDKGIIAKFNDPDEKCSIPGTSPESRRSSFASVDLEKQRGVHIIFMEHMFTLGTHTVSQVV